MEVPASGAAGPGLWAGADGSARTADAAAAVAAGFTAARAGGLLCEGGGNQVVLDDMPRTELYEIGRVFNQLSMETRRQFDVLSHINGAYARLVPQRLLELLHRRDVLELSPGDCSAIDGALLLLLPAGLPRDGEALQAFAASAVWQAGPGGGLFTAYDESTGALTAVFRHAEQAVCCAQKCAAGAGQYAALTAVIHEQVTVGVFGSEEQLLPLVFSSGLARRLAVMARLRSFGVVLVHNRPANGLRLLGRDRDSIYYEDPSYRPADWRGQWRDAAPYWESAMEHFLPVILWGRCAGSRVCSGSLRWILLPGGIFCAVKRCAAA